MPTHAKTIRAASKTAPASSVNRSRPRLLGDELAEAGLEDRNPARLEILDPLRDDVADDHVVAQVGEAGGGHEPDPARAQDADRGPFAHLTAANGFKPLAMASIVSFESSRRSVFETQYTAPFSSNATIWSLEPS